MTSTEMTSTEEAERVHFLACVLVTAVEGGVNYWAEVREYRVVEGEDRLFVSVSVEIRDAEGEGEWQAVTLDTVEKGIAKIKTREIRLNREIVAEVLLGDRDPKYADIDATAADCIIQAGLFGDIVYG